MGVDCAFYMMHRYQGGQFSISWTATGFMAADKIDLYSTWIYLLSQMRACVLSMTTCMFCVCSDLVLSDNPQRVFTGVPAAAATYTYINFLLLLLLLFISPTMHT